MIVLRWISAALGWLEDMIAHLSGPALTAGLGIALVDLLTDGKLLASVPALLFGWAIAQAVGVDGQLVGSAAKAGRAWRSGRYVVAISYGLLIVALAYVAYLASAAFAMQQAYGITTTEALARLGMDPQSWLWQRCALTVFLVILAGVLRHDEKHEKAQESDEDRRRRMQRELEDRAHKAALWQATTSGLASAGRAALVAAKASTIEGTTDPLMDAQEAEDQAPDSEAEVEAEAPTMRRARAGRSAAPAGLMSAPDFHKMLVDGGVSITQEAARGIVRTERDFAQIGTTYYANKRALTTRANRMINDAHPTITLVG